jgi:hypothetical protein
MTKKEQPNYPDEYLDGDGYPTEATLEMIEKWDVLERGVEGLLLFIESIWWMREWGFIRDGEKLELHTGGWSGNEDIIRSLRKNFFWCFFWESSRRGGHYYFEEIKDFKK